MNKLSISTIFIMTLLLLATACAPIDVSRKESKTFDFSTLKTYSWIPNEQEEFVGIAVDKKVLDEAIVTDVNKALQSKGYILSEDNPDFRISYIVTVQGVRRAAQINSYYGNMGYGAYYGQGSNIYGYNAYERQRTASYTEGMLVIDTIYVATKEHLWRGVAQTPVGVYKSEDKKRKRVTTIVNKILKQFPSR